ncbi:ParA family protein [Ruminococcus sp.]|uniref:ParA family protein n=1 Tax=Ruminococcus sp. TaxID=41978 RepID=UPI003996349D
MRKRLKAYSFAGGGREVRLCVGGLSSSLGILLINALVAADEMIVPVQSQKFAMDGLRSLMNLYQQIRSMVNPTLRMRGILPTMVNDRTTISREVMWQMGQQYEDVLFHTVIHNSVEAAKAAAAGNMIAVRTKLGAEYAALAEEIIQYDDLQGIRGADDETNQN